MENFWSNIICNCNHPKLEGTDFKEVMLKEQTYQNTAQGMLM